MSGPARAAHRRAVQVANGPWQVIDRCAVQTAKGPARVADRSAVQVMCDPLWAADRRAVQMMIGPVRAPDHHAAQVVPAPVEKVEQINKSAHFSTMNTIIYVVLLAKPHSVKRRNYMHGSCLWLDHSDSEAFNCSQKNMFVMGTRFV